MLDKFLSLKKSRPELMDTILVGSASLVGSVFSYLLQFVLGRKLSVEDYGTFNTLLALSSLVGVFSAVFGVSLVKVVSEIYVKEKVSKLKALFFNLIKISFVVSIVSFFIIFVLRGFISSYLKINDTFLITLFGISIGLGFYNIIPISYMQGMQEFKKYSIFYILSLFIRFLIPTILVLMGLGLRGVFTGLPLSGVLSILIGVFILGFGFKGVKDTDLSKYYEKILVFGLSVILVNLSTMAFTNIDLIMVKKYFSPEDAGYYAGAMTLGKILLFGAGSVSIVMFPKITALYSKGEEFLGRLKNLFLLLVLILTVGVLCYQIFPGILTRLFFGKTFEDSIIYLPMFSVFVALYVLVQFLVMFFLAIDKKQVGFLLFPGVLIQFILLNIFHNSIFDVIKINIGVSFLTLFLLLIYFYFNIPGFKKIRKVEPIEEIPPLIVN